MLEDKGWEDPRSVNSPRRILSFSKNRKPLCSFQTQTTEIQVLVFLEIRDPKTSEVYGFVGSITTVVATGLPILIFKKLSLLFRTYPYV